MNPAIRSWRAAVAVALCTTLFTSQVTLAEEKEDDIFYVLGVAASQGLRAFGLSERELDTVLEGVKDGVTGDAGSVDPREHMAAIQELQRERMAAVAAEEKKRSMEFIASAAKEKGATQYDSGLIMTTLSEGSGSSPTATDTVRVHYHGTFRTGDVFDSSVQRGQPATFPLNGVIPCWTEGVAKMKVGGKSKLVCPSDIAYGDNGRPPSIPGGAALVFEVELLEIVSSAN